MLAVHDVFNVYEFYFVVVYYFSLLKQVDELHICSFIYVLQKQVLRVRCQLIVN